MLGQLSRMPAPLGITSFLLFTFAVLPGIPFAPFITLSAAMGYIAILPRHKNKLRSRNHR